MFVRTATQAHCSTTTKIPPPIMMESPVMRCHCSKTMTIIPSSTSSASTSSTSSVACFRTCKTTQSLWKPTLIIMFASVHSSLMGPTSGIPYTWTRTDDFVLVCTGMYWYVGVQHFTIWYVLVYTSMYQTAIIRTWYIPVYTASKS